MRRVTPSLPRIAAALLGTLPGAALAHHDLAIAARSVADEALLALLMAVAGIGYAVGVVRLWQRAGSGRAIRRIDAVRFALGWAATACAVWSPIDALAARSFGMHMVQHELLMVVAAPLFVTARVYEAWGWALPRGGARVLASVAAGWRRLAAPWSAWWTHAVAVWVWHVPAFFLAALSSVWLHDLQHISFFASALLFWWAVFERRGRTRDLTSIALLLTTMLHTSALGFFLTFAPTAWYATAEAAPFALTALEDQQLGGLVMWVLGGLAYVAAALAIVAQWLAPERGRRAVAPAESAQAPLPSGERISSG